MADEKPLSGRIALITGASRGIGRSVALGLAGAGAHVVLLARTVGGLEEVDDEIRSGVHPGDGRCACVGGGDRVDDCGGHRSGRD